MVRQVWMAGTVMNLGCCERLMDAVLCLQQTYTVFSGCTRVILLHTSQRRSRQKAGSPVAYAPMLKALQLKIFSINALAKNGKDRSKRFHKRKD